MKCYGVFVPVFKMVPALIKLPAKGRLIIPNFGMVGCPLCGQNLFAFGQIARYVECIAK